VTLHGWQSSILLMPAGCQQKVAAIHRFRTTLTRIYYMRRCMEPFSYGMIMMQTDEALNNRLQRPYILCSTRTTLDLFLYMTISKQQNVREV